jgi:hypothetical protein
MPTEQEKQRETEARHRNLRELRKNQEALEDIPHQRFLRIVGLFQAMPVSNGGALENAEVVARFRELRSFIDHQLDHDGKDFAKYEMADYLHNLHLLLARIISLDFVEANIPSLLDEYRSLVGEQAFQAYTLSPFHGPVEAGDKSGVVDSERVARYERKVRAGYVNLINEIRRFRLYEEHIENTRGYLIYAVGKMLLRLLAMPSLLVVLYLAWTALSSSASRHGSPLYGGLTGLALVSISAIAGAFGSFVSVLLRIQGLRDNNQLAQNIVAFKFSEKAVRMAPVTGTAFAVVLCFVFGAGLVSGSLFPLVNSQAWMFTLFDSAELAKWVVWCFLAGFSERLVPDMLDRLSDRTRKADENRLVVPGLPSLPAPRS